jgi:D-sedoheptulose 7-phosphate isomerase
VADRLTATAQVGAYLTELHQAMQTVLSPALEEAVGILLAARERGATVYFCGNGGSASTASHWALDLSKNTRHPVKGRFRTGCLVDNLGLVTAWANDNGYDQVFLEQARTLLRPGDVLVAISGSGNSPNVLLAVDYAREVGCPVIGLIGFDGGRLRERVDVALVVPGRNIEQAEDGHLILNHALCTAIKAMDAAG